MTSMPSKAGAPAKRGILTFFQNEMNVKESSKTVDRDQEGEAIDRASSSATIGRATEVIDDSLVEDVNFRNGPVEKSDIGVSNGGGDGDRMLVDDKENHEEQYMQQGDGLDGLTACESNSRLEKVLKKQREKDERELRRRKQREERELQKLKEKQERELKKQQEKKERELVKQREREERELKKQKEREERELKKEEERKRKEEEKRKVEDKRRKREEAKERSQSRIGSFFKRTPVTKSQVDTKDDYEKTFLPFYIKRDVKMADQFQLNRHQLIEREKCIDDLITNAPSIENTKSWFVLRKRRIGDEAETPLKAVEVLQQMTSKNKTDQELQALLSRVPHRFIKFYENVRPPYVGTYSKTVILPRDNPFSTDGTGFNYDYDSDLDWINEDDEGGDIDDLENDEDDEDEDDEGDEGDEHEFDGFLDSDEDPSISSKKKSLGPLVSTVLLARDFARMETEDQEYFNLVSVEYLVEEQPFPVDPNYSPRKRPQTQDETDPTSHIDHKPSTPKKTKTLIVHTKDLLKVFDEVHESTFSLGTISEIIQKHIPQYSKETIKNTVKQYAARSTGKGNTTRKWEVRDLELWEQLKSEL
ncbi:Rlf2p Ecym_8362 [Eremothecium cymbalariae DBVPG|uniref:Chromatin assembly factor 1 subunit p90 n=1 Tax=Eremothecium cymbalariae (strain CBS 270.75 / DBVPG 7215 / KCTC 17166 / NRRL Y-17582) TaxID=931890 RepID=G8JXR1_ERECY|nr:Hypothetical protein Ecym_8362 [Eremothecium cymbalariae DBVPG\